MKLPANQTFLNMKQPELGQKIANLRKAKGLTQEELVEQCNISVRTIQRIETGEVTPRSYTVKTILSALDYKWTEEENKGPSLTKGQKNGLLAGGIAGVFYFLLGFPEGYFEFFRFSMNWSNPFSANTDTYQLVPFDQTAYLLTKVLVLIAFIPFLTGFFKLGAVLGNKLLQIMSIALIISISLIICYDIVSLFYDASERLLVSMAISIIFGLFSIIFGVALIQSRVQLGSISLIAGIIEIIAGVMLIFINPLGLILQMPAELLEAIILFQAIKRFSPRTETSFS